MADISPDIAIARMSSLGLYPCRGCGDFAPAKIFALTDTGLPVALCRACADDPVQRALLISLLTGRSAAEPHTN